MKISDKMPYAIRISPNIYNEAFPFIARQTKAIDAQKYFFSIYTETIPDI